ncbi:cholesterol 7-desaturase nvd-like [Centruroides vittatus]|uniref:cholesterol 7-desaturase nvd-like n=1 Tax=Centruroides vittatus TaxID=120091 RepID=UPI00350FFC17
MQDITDSRYDNGGTNAKKSHRKRMQLLRETNRLRRSKEYPPAYPNGWIPLFESRDLPVGKCKPVTALGQQFVVFRGKTGTCFVLDGYCPHLGAHLGTDGKVHEDCIECPFHGWRFAGQDGACVKIPYAEKIPKVAKIKTWESIEQNGFIYVWYHAENEPPLWKPPVVPEIENRLMQYIGRSEHVANCHIQEIAENVADFAHLDCVHKYGPFRQRAIRHYYAPSRFAAIINYIFFYSERCMFERDVRLWNYKMYLKNPIYIKEDRQIARFRKWYSQFYSENSPKIEKQDLNW